MTGAIYDSRFPKVVKTFTSALTDTRAELTLYFETSQWGLYIVLLHSSQGKSAESWYGDKCICLALPSTNLHLVVFAVEAVKAKVFCVKEENINWTQLPAVTMIYLGTDRFCYMQALKVKDRGLWWS